VAPQLRRHFAKLDELFKQHKEVTLVTAAILLILVAFIDYITGVDFSFSIFYLFPISVVAWYVGLRAGVLASVAGAVLWFIVDSVLGEHLYENPAAGYWNTLVRFGFFIIVTVTLSRLRSSLEAIRSHTDELTMAYTELDRARKEQLIMKDQILSHVSHELRTPLASVHQFITILLDGLAGEIRKEQKDYLQIALQNVNQLNKMIDDLLESARADSGKWHFKPEPMNLQVILEGLVQTFDSAAVGKKITLAIEVGQNLPSLLADPDRVRQVLLNLLDNALKFTPEGGAIRVRAGVFEQDPAFVCISVADTGPGISPEDQEKLFQRLYQKDEASASSRKGLGLGLYICKEIVSRHKGTIWVASQPGRGSTFFFTLPVYSPSSQSASPPTEGSS
jgi:signal transduction histidine kinase